MTQYFSRHSQCHTFCTIKHRPILKCGKNTASMFMITQATSSTSESRATVRTGNQHAVNYRVTTKMEVFKGCCLKHQIRPISFFFLEFFHPTQIRLPLGCDLVLWQYESHIRGRLLYIFPRLLFPKSPLTTLSHTCGLTIDVNGIES